MRREKRRLRDAGREGTPSEEGGALRKKKKGGRKANKASDMKKRGRVWMGFPLTGGGGGKIRHCGRGEGGRSWLIYLGEWAFCQGGGENENLSTVRGGKRKG